MMDKFLMAEYDAVKYNCWHFACDVWATLSPLPVHPPGAWPNASDPADTLHTLASSMVGQFKTLDKPVTPCLVLMRRTGLAPHVGVYLNGKVLQLNQRGASCTDLDHATACFPTVTYHAPK